MTNCTSTFFNSPSPLQTAVLFLVFNRPDTTSRVFEAIRQAKPPRLYVSADGPREGRDGEAELVSRVRGIATAVDWPCEVKTLFREENLGCKYAVSGAITWFFEQEEKGIILEDDCLPSQSFFWFCESMLNIFGKNDGIMCVTGTNITCGLSFDGDYFFSKYALMWGWASWARAWQKYDVELSNWPSKNGQSEQLRTLGLGKKTEIMLWKKLLSKTQNNKIDTWDFQWIYSCWLYDGLTVAPAKNLVKNLGFGENATHTLGTDRYRSDLVPNEMPFPLEHPSGPIVHQDADAFISRYWFYSTWANVAKLLLLDVPGVRRLNEFRKVLFKY